MTCSILFLLATDYITYLGPVCNMDQEVVTVHCKSVDWLLNSFQNHIGLHQGKNGRVPMEVEVLKRHSFKA